MNLALHTRANREFFEHKCAPKKSTWYEWVKCGLVKGKIIGEQIYIDLNWFAVNDIIVDSCDNNTNKLCGTDLLR